MCGIVTRNCVYQRHGKPFKFFPSCLKLLKTLIAPVLLVHVLSACAVEGDFGRIQPTVFSKIGDQVLLNADIMTRGLNRPELDRDEIVLRETGHILTRPLELAPQIVDIPPQLPEEMRGRYERDHGTPPPGLIARSLDKDHQLLTRFGEAARRVIRTYSQQMESVLRYDPVLRARKRNEARARMQENLDYIDSVFAGFGHRLQAYHYAIGAIRSHEEGRFASELEGSLAHLRDRTASLEYELKHFAGAAMARGEFHEPRFAARDPAFFERRPSYSVPVQTEPREEAYPAPPQNVPFK